MNKAILYILANLKNSSKTQKPLTDVYYSKESMELCNLLYKKGYISGYKHVGNRIIINLKYHNHRKGLIYDVRIYSTPSRKLFITHQNLLKKYSLYEAVILSTTAGLLTVADAYQLGLGGELLFKIN